MVPPRGRTRARYWPGDEEMAKKDDDLGAPGHPRIVAQWQASRPPRRRAVARLVAYVVFCALLLFAIYRLLQSSSPGRGDRKPPPGSSAGFNTPRKQQEAPPRTYSGPIKFPELGGTLRAISGTGGSIDRNKNVLFATASLRSASILLPMACQMAARDQNWVHFVLASRSEISIKELLNINGIDDSCKLYLHDARPDSVAVSTEPRMRLAAARALYFVNNYMHPQAVIIDSSSAEEDYFLRGFRDQIRGTKSALIELPEKPGNRLAWITQLSASALSAWNSVDFDIVVQAPLTGSGNLIRLLGSLARADMSAVTPPQLTIELPSTVEAPLEKMLDKFRWPSSGFKELPRANMLSLRHRIPRSKMTEEGSSIRFLESFWPARPRNSHVLVLGPHTEVSPQFFHCKVPGTDEMDAHLLTTHSDVKFTLLNTLYSRASILGDWSDNIMGISFQSPTTHLDATTPFAVPERSSAKPGPFLWQAPSSDATLFLGEKWVELHGYVSQLLEAQGLRDDMPATLAKKDVSKKYPAWLEYALQLSRLRGYLTLYPSQETASVIMGSHSDLGDTPEEYMGDDEIEEGENNGKADRATLKFDPDSQIDMLTTLPQGGEFADLDGLPLLSWGGKSATLEDVRKDARQHARLFRREVGQCEAPEPGAEEEGEEEEPRVDKAARDLFCTNKKKG
ncbi:hypothetical protein B0J13DRAFT_523085 [Dactylonectria estremocensis]|uniref:Glycosyltransferase 2 n=1 Tax=Dactylonectria estremocensis TaxID=1079267 RepID=A0A9P9JBE9_9HYPO|nr:hypothetical protein B0J13DRAFT_523085 [Dactylonectria estremocensis]